VARLDLGEPSQLVGHLGVTGPVGVDTQLRGLHRLGAVVLGEICEEVALAPTEQARQKSHGPEARIERSGASQARRPEGSLPSGFRLENAVKRRRWDAMARITVEDCLEHVPNRFELVLLAARRAKQLLKGARPLVESDNKEIVTALREVAAERVRLEYAE